MDLPSELKERIDLLLAQEKISPLIQGAHTLSSRYRTPDHSRAFVTSAAHRLAYLITRMPATYAAIREALQNVKQALHAPVHTLLDVGAGPGTGYWAAREEFSALQDVLCLEKDLEFITLGKKLAQSSHVQWRPFDLIKEKFSFGQFDMVLCSYALNELPEKTQEELVLSLWEAAAQVLVIVEPGTPAGFERIRKARDKLIAWGAHMAAPCPHALACPMAGTDWCHFAARVERSALHRKLKGAELNYEDEKFSYIAVSRTPISLSHGRIIRRPEKNSGHVRLTLCSAQGIEANTVSRKEGEVYKWARKAEWGDVK